MTINEIKEIIKKEEYEIYGIRADYDIKYEIGDICNVSHQWWQDPPPEEAGYEYVDDLGWDGGELDGTCALEVTEDNIEEILKASKMYMGIHTTLIAGNSYMAGNDSGEVIIDRAKVLAVIE